MRILMRITSCVVICMPFGSLFFRSLIGLIDFQDCCSWPVKVFADVGSPEGGVSVQAGLAESGCGEDEAVFVSLEERWMASSCCFT